MTDTTISQSGTASTTRNSALSMLIDGIFAQTLETQEEYLEEIKRRKVRSETSSETTTDSGLMAAASTEGGTAPTTVGATSATADEAEATADPEALAAALLEAEADCTCDDTWAVTPMEYNGKDGFQIDLKNGFKIQAFEDEVFIIHYDDCGCETDRTRVWGDPHVDEQGFENDTNNKGGKDWDFKNRNTNFTFVLPDGTKITFDTAPVGGWDSFDAPTFTTAIHVSRGNQGITIEGLANDWNKVRMEDGCAVDDGDVRWTDVGGCLDSDIQDGVVAFYDGEEGNNTGWVFRDDCGCEDEVTTDLANAEEYAFETNPEDDQDYTPEEPDDHSETQELTDAPEQEPGDSTVEPETPEEHIDHPAELVSAEPVQEAEPEIIESENPIVVAPVVDAPLTIAEPAEKSAAEIVTVMPTVIDMPEMTAPIITVRPEIIQPSTPLLTLDQFSQPAINMPTIQTEISIAAPESLINTIVSNEMNAAPSVQSFSSSGANSPVMMPFLNWNSILQNVFITQKDTHDEDDHHA